MVKTKEQIKTTQKKYYEKNKEKILERVKKYKQKNKEKIKQKNKEYREKTDMKTPKKIRCKIISNWKSRGIICDYKYYYNIYLQQIKCYYCRKEFKNTKNRCLDHNHNITNDYNVRGIICRSCNVKDVYK